MYNMFTGAPSNFELLCVSLFDFRSAIDISICETAVYL